MNFLKLLALSAVLTGTAFCVGRSALHAQPSRPGPVPGVSIDNFAFSPQLLRIPVGATVVWTNHDDTPHTVVGTDQQFRSPALDTDGTFSFTFAEAGTFNYFCSVHPMMTGKIVVEQN